MSIVVSNKKNNRSIYNKWYYLENREYLLEYAKVYYSINREEILNRQTVYRLSRRLLPAAPPP